MQLRFPKNESTSISRVDKTYLMKRQDIHEKYNGDSAPSISGIQIFRVTMHVR